MSRITVAVIGLIGVASVNLLAPALAHQLSRTIGHRPSAGAEAAGTAPAPSIAAGTDNSALLVAR